MVIHLISYITGNACIATVIHAVRLEALPQKAEGLYYSMACSCVFI